jgi:hypothetical protein
MSLMRKETLDPFHSEKEKQSELNNIMKNAWNKAEEMKQKKKSIQSH